MSVPEAVWNEIKALKAAHAELAARVDDIGVRFAAHLRLAVAIESPAPAPDPVCAGPKETDMCTCHHNYGSHWGIGGACLSYDCKCQSYNPTAEPEPAPLDPVQFHIAEAYRAIPDDQIGKMVARALRDAWRQLHELPERADVHFDMLAYGRDGAR